MGRNFWYMRESKHTNFHCIVEHVPQALFSSRLLFVKVWVKSPAFAKVYNRLPWRTFWSIPSTF